MTDPTAPPTATSEPAPTAPVPAEAKKPAKPGFAFTTDGCRSDVRFGALLVLVAIFVWLWLGPVVSSRLYLIGAPFLLWGIPMQALQARREGRPGYPWRLGLAMGIGGALMWPDLVYREGVGQPLQWQPIAPLLVAAGVWILAWWPVARPRPAAVSA